ncbi:hypothetical protein [Lacinutrix sp.]|uniref:hypothetical protein n=1 Tax=Lacinutrix sp. TaxID=1937692 RepID=UPI0025C29517|nr:hypothetical protein [Lacinutrix sp.]
MLSKLYTFINKYALVLILSIAVLARVIIALTYGAITISPDSEDYIALGKLLTTFNLENYPGNRTPGYSFLIALANNSLVITVIFQLFIGLLSTYLLFDFSLRKTKNKITAFWVTFITTSFMQFLFFEFAILTETLTVFLVLFSFWIIERYQLFSAKTPKKYYLLLSIVLSWLYLTKPLFIYFSLGFALFFFVKQFKFNKKDALIKSVIVILIPFLSYFTWNNFNKQNIGYFTNTYYFGINLSQTATSFFEKAPDEDALIRDIFVRKRDSIIREKNDKAYPMTIWYAHDELLKKTQLSPQDLSAELGRISKNLFKEHPDLYAKQVFKSACLFFGYKDSMKWNAEKFSNKYFRYGFNYFWAYFQKHVLVLLNILFLLFSVRILFLFFKSKCSLFNMNLFIVCIVLSGALAQALVAFGSNSRFAFPFLPLIVYFVVINVLDLKSKYLSEKKS